MTFSPNGEQIPTVFLKDDRVVEVTFTEWEPSPTDPGEWDMCGDQVLHIDLPNGADTLLFELPNGCFYAPIEVPPNATWAWHTGWKADTPPSELTQAFKCYAGQFTRTIEQTAEASSR
jgi:hypothetical protein